MKSTVIFRDLRNYLVNKIRNQHPEWSNQGCYTMQVVGKKEAFSLYRRKYNDIGELPATFVNSTLKGKISDCKFQGYHYYWFIEEIQEE